jgi:hypothetical protein
VQGCSLAAEGIAFRRAPKHPASQPEEQVVFEVGFAGLVTAARPANRSESGREFRLISAAPQVEFLSRKHAGVCTGNELPGTVALLPARPDVTDAGIATAPTMIFLQTWCKT